MSIECKVCGYENEDDRKYCEICNTDLSDFMDVVEPEKSLAEPFPQPYAEKETHKINVYGTKKYYVSCENSRTKTYVESDSISSYYCEGCKEEHQIDGFFWIVQEELTESENITSDSHKADSVIEQVNRTSGQHLLLEDVDTHFKIEISSAGGTFGRYGTYGSEYLQSDPRGRMVSGEHCRFKYEYEKWTIEHLSRTNDTVYNGRKLEHGYEEAIRDGKIITFANAMSFMVRIF